MRPGSGRTFFIGFFSSLGSTLFLRSKGLDLLLLPNPALTITIIFFASAFYFFLLHCDCWTLDFFSFIITTIIDTWVLFGYDFWKRSIGTWTRRWIEPFSPQMSLVGQRHLGVLISEKHGVGINGFSPHIGCRVRQKGGQKC
jgi:hypothetical protein